MVQPILFSFQYVCAHDRKNVTNVNLGLYKNNVIVYRLNALDICIDEDSNVVLLPPIRDRVNLYSPANYNAVTSANEHVFVETENLL